MISTDLPQIIEFALTRTDAIRLMHLIQARTECQRLRGDPVDGSLLGLYAYFYLAVYETALASDRHISPSGA